VSYTFLTFFQLLHPVSTFASNNKQEYQGIHPLA
jgi:hypothetical protein